MRLLVQVAIFASLSFPGMALVRSISSTLLWKAYVADPLGAIGLGDRGATKEARKCLLFVSGERRSTKNPATRAGFCLV